VSPSGERRRNNARSKLDASHTTTATLLSLSPLLENTELDKPHTDTISGLRHGTQFGVPMREELVGMCGDTGQVK